MTVTVYTKPACVQCTATKKSLDKYGIDYELVDLTEDPEDPEALDYVMSLGYAQAPIVVAGDTHWGGFRPDAIQGLASQAA